VEVGGAGRDLDVVLLATLVDRHGALRQRAGDVGEEPAGKQHLPVPLDLRVELDRDAELAVGGAGDRVAALGDEHDPAERGQGRPGREGAGRGLECIQERIAFGCQLHRLPNLPLLKV
jgi:hypothetical protein